MGVQNRAMQQKKYLSYLFVFCFLKKLGIKEGKADPLCKNPMTFNFVNVSTVQRTTPTFGTMLLTREILLCSNGTAP